MMIAPRTIHSGVRSLCQKIGCIGEPIWVDVSPDRDGEINECFLNVRKYIGKHGGSIQHGWCIWEKPGLFIEGEFHGVWVSPEGDFLDITPKKENENRILFLPDLNRVFEEKTYKRLDNVRLAISPHPAVQEFLRVAAEFHKFKEDSTTPENPKMMSMNSDELHAHQIRMASAQMAMMQIPIGRNEKCRCGSGKKHKKCCGQIKG